jgi:hypothetical protein
MHSLITILAVAALFSPAVMAQPKAPSWDWRPRYQEFQALVERRPISNEAKARLVALLAIENDLFGVIRDTTGEAPAAAMGEAYCSYIGDLSAEVYKLVKDGYTPGVQALIASSYDAHSEIGRFIATHLWREALPYFLGLDRTREQGVLYSDGIEMLGMIYRRHSQEMPASERLRVENQLLNALTDPLLVVREGGMDAVVEAGLKSAIPLLRERAEKSERSPGTDGDFERKMALQAIQKLEKLP